MSEAALFDAPEPEARSAHLSADGLYRYRLARRWDDSLPTITFVMLNPSTADANEDDPTIRRCRGFAQRLGGGALHVVNLYAFRATKPADMLRAADPIGPLNDEVLVEELAYAGQVIAAWGVNARPDRVAEVLRLPGANYFSVLGVTKDGAPRHPLYLRADAPLTRWPA